LVKAASRNSLKRPLLPAVARTHISPTAKCDESIL
jgi:hypothetical protein